MLKIVLQFLLTFGLGTSLVAQVHFNEITIEQAMQRAQIENKHIFVDTYAPWCKPCKKLEPVFKDREVVEMLNKNFINVRINADDVKAAEFKNKYRVVFLPTLLFLDRNGAIKVKVDKVISKSELMSFADHAVNSNVVYNSMTILQNPTVHTRPSNPVINPAPKKAPPTTRKTETTTENTSSSTVSTPKPKSEVKKTPTRRPPPSTTVKKDEKILYVLDEALDAPPEILYQEAYFRMELMDGSHWDVANQYLSTQYEWGTEKNMRFIFDFLKDTDSDDFLYFIENKEAFVKLFGEKQVEITTDILVETKLNQGYPRPDFQKAKLLYSYIDGTNAKEKAYRYSIGRLYDERKFDAFEKLALQYLTEKPQGDKDIKYLYAAYIEYQYNNKPKLKKAVEYVQDCIAVNDEQYIYYETLAKLHFKLKNKQEALLAVQKGISIAQSKGASQANLMMLMEDIEQL